MVGDFNKQLCLVVVVTIEGELNESAGPPVDPQKHPSMGTTLPGLTKCNFHTSLFEEIITVTLSTPTYFLGPSHHSELNYAS
jgi:hypothetical protein